MDMIDNLRDHLAQHREFLSFQLGDSEYGLDILTVREIRAYENPTRIANTPPFILGVINLRGEIVPVVDLRIKFGQPNPRYDSLTVVIILKLANRVIGLVVDGVSDVIALAPEAIKPAPDFNAGMDMSYIRGLASLEGRMLILVDIGRFLSSDEMGLIKAAETELQAA